MVTPIQPVPLYEWVSNHNPPAELSYKKGWWDCIEFIYRLKDTYDGAFDISVVATFTMNTPPPTEQLLMPTFRLHHAEGEFLLRLDFSSLIDPQWVVSVTRQRKEKVPLYGLIDEDAFLEPESVSGFEPSWVYPCYSRDPSRFTCALEDEWKLYAFLWIFTHPETAEEKHDGQP